MFGDPNKLDEAGNLMQSDTGCIRSQPANSTAGRGFADVKSYHSA
jgi:hypothetical protein